MADNDSSSLSDPTSEVPSQAPDIGPTGEGLPSELQAALLSLVKEFEAQNRAPRVEELRLLQRRHEYWKGNQNIYYDGIDKEWKPITSTGGISTKIDNNEEQARYDYVTNIYAANCLIDMATLCQNPPAYAYFPKDPTLSKDLATSRAAKAVSQYIADNNRLDLKQIDLAWHWYNDGGCCSFTRYEVNGQKYGFTPQPIMGQAPGKLTPDAMNCSSCGMRQDLPEGWAQGDMLQVPQTCPQCGRPLGPQNVQPGISGMVPKQLGVKQNPNGQERINYVSFIEIERPFYCKAQDEYPWLKWETEVPKAKLRALYPKYADKIDVPDSGTSDYVGQGGRNARISLAATSFGRVVPEGTAESLVTFKRVWLRSWAFYQVDDKSVRQKLLTIYPDGCYLACTTDTYLESRNEDLDDVWVVSHAMPGDGQARLSIGEMMVDVQSRYNTEENIQTETYERGISTRFMDTDVYDVDAYQASGSLPGVTMGAQAKPGQSLADAIYDSPPTSVSPQMLQHSNDLRGEVSQLLTSNQPGIFGGDVGQNKTARGISMVKEAAMGVKALFKIPMNDFHARTMQNAIKCFQKNRTSDTASAIEGADGQMEAKIISLEELAGNVLVRSEVGSAYPMSIAQKRDLATQLLNNPPIATALGLLSPGGIVVLRDLLGIDDFEPPDYNARTKQARETRMMLDGQQVPVNPIMDNHDIHVKQIQDFWESNEGQQAELQNPQGVALLQQHLLEHLQAKAQQTSLSQMPQAPGGQPGVSQPAAGATPPAQ